MSEAGKGRGRKGGRPEEGPAGSSLGPGTGGSSSRVGWIVSANIVAVLAVVLAVVALVLQFTDEDEDNGQAVVGQPSPTVQPTVPVQPTPTPPTVVEVSVDDDPFIGPEDAAVTIVEFSDYR
jgi:protein-disulfide isomerase